jgi:hypothetical protein
MIEQVHVNVIETNGRIMTERVHVNVIRILNAHSVTPPFDAVKS